jgi:hypothetical protein
MPLPVVICYTFAMKDGISLPQGLCLDLDRTRLIKLMAVSSKVCFKSI